MFAPVVAPPGRLLRLAVVLDQRNPPARIGHLALMAELAGIDTLWTSPALAAASSEPLTPVRQTVALAAQATKTIHLGATFASDGAGEAEELASGLGDRLEIGFAEPSPAAAREGRVRAPAREPLKPWLRFAPRLWLEAPDQAALTEAARHAAGALLSAPLASDLPSLPSLLKAASQAASRDPATLAVAIELPVSIGRTEAEAYARADAEPAFRVLGHPKDAGIFGTLEQCQERVIALAHAGVTELRCIVPNTPDVHDVLAQLTAMVAGSKRALRPGEERSRHPEPPSWAGPRA